MTNPSVENKVVVKIFGEDYPITGSTDPAYISKIADFVDSRMQEVSKRSHTNSREKVAILTALSLASELQARSADLDQLASDQDASLDALLDRLNSALGDNSSTDQ